MSIAAAFLRYVAHRRPRGASDRTPAVVVTLFRLVVVLPGARHEQRGQS
jgi:hypothetical protein